VNLKQLFRSEDTVAFQVSSTSCQVRPPCWSGTSSLLAAPFLSCAPGLRIWRCCSAATGGIGGGISEAAGPRHHYGPPVVM
jgi:hypothetical protein